MMILQEGIMEQKNMVPEYRKKVSALYSVGQGKYLLADSISARIYPASVTKLLCACTALQFLSPDDVITVGDEYHLIDEHSSLALVFPGYRVYLKDLFAGALLSSGCDAAYTIAAAAARAAFPDREMNALQAVECFVSLMNEYAGKIGMNDSRFVTPDGQDDEGQYVTAADLIKLGVHALNIPAIRETTTLSNKITDIVSGEHLVWLTTNLMRDTGSEYYLPDCIGLKTGTTTGAGSGFLGAFERGGDTYISFVSGNDTRVETFERTMNMLKEHT